ncbi:GIN domain-containing protein [Brevundimonas sp. TWP2-3-2]|uniref:GIN domain-containing protein n=1 Tax=unclassified Brevundimonas TaxID=2622653 RepID=UPI003CF576EA
MKAFVTAAASVALLAALGAAAPASAKTDREVRIRYAAARVVVIVENRTDIAVEIEPGSGGLPLPTVTRNGDEVRINGNLGRRAFRRCESGPANARQPGEGASVEVREHGRVNLSAAPLIVVRTPPAVDISTEDSAVFGSIGRGATSIELGSGGCGDWTVANTAGSADLSIGGSGSIRAGTSSSLQASISGSGDITAGATGELDASVSGSGTITVAGATGDVDAAISGSGDIRVNSGRPRSVDASIAGSGDIIVTGDAGPLDASIAGSGNITVTGTAASVDASLLGGGDVLVGRVTGSVSQSVMGGGRVRIGN